MISRLVAGKIKKLDERFENWIIYEIKFGNRGLEIRFNNDTNEVHIYLHSVKGEYIKNQKRILYKAAKEIIIGLSKERSVEINYKFMTEIENLAEWAGKEGRKIFEWDNEIVQDGGVGKDLFVFSKKFIPKNNN